jgi:tRNA pseudouridine38-40 synthase
MYLSADSCIKKNNLTKYAAQIAYDGTAYYGWQEQAGLPTIESTFKRVLTKTIGAPVNLAAASRTDAQVHASGQIVMFTHHLHIEPQKLKKIVNDNLPQDIFVHDMVHARADFHPWYDVAYKEYQYRVSLTRPCPRQSRYVWYYKGKVDLQHLSDCITYFEGTHSFNAFATLEKKDADSVKTIKKVTLHYNEPSDEWHISIIGHSFLRHMIRRIVGASLYMAHHTQLPLSLIKQSLEEKKRIIELPTAPGHGLTLTTITYSKGLT